MEIINALKVLVIVDHMKHNSEAWMQADDVGQRHELEMENQKFGGYLNSEYHVPAVYCPSDGVWYYGSVGGYQLYDIY